MSSYYFSELPIQPFPLIVELIKFLVFLPFWGSGISKKPEMVCCHESKDDAPTSGRDVAPPTKAAQCLSREDTETVLRSLGLLGGLEGAKLPEKLDADAISRMMEEEDPGMDEVKETFDIFDKNGDGFIDGEELQQILCNLGFNEGVEIDNCRRMIGVFDKNNDTRLDFDEFVTFMDHCLS